MKTNLETAFTGKIEINGTCIEGVPEELPDNFVDYITYFKQKELEKSLKGEIPPISFTLEED